MSLTLAGRHPDFENRKARRREGRTEPEQGGKGRDHGKEAACKRTGADAHVECGNVECGGHIRIVWRTLYGRALQADDECGD